MYLEPISPSRTLFHSRSLSGAECGSGWLAGLVLLCSHSGFRYAYVHLAQNVRWVYVSVPFSVQLFSIWISMKHIGHFCSCSTRKHLNHNILMMREKWVYSCFSRSLFVQVIPIPHTHIFTTPFSQSAASPSSSSSSSTMGIVCMCACACVHV